MAIFENIDGNYCFSNFLNCLRIDTKKCFPYYLFVYLKTIYKLNYMEYLQNQTTGIKNLIWEEFINIPVILPSYMTQQKIAAEVHSRMDRAQALKREAAEILEKAKKEIEDIILGKNK